MNKYIYIYLYIFVYNLVSKHVNTFCRDVTYYQTHKNALGLERNKTLNKQTEWHSTYLFIIMYHQYDMHVISCDQTSSTICFLSEALWMPEAAIMAGIVTSLRSHHQQFILMVDLVPTAEAAALNMSLGQPVYK